MKLNVDEMPVKTLKKGYTYDAEAGRFVCLFCRQQYEEGYVYPFDGKLAAAPKAMELHVRAQHGSPFAQLIALDKKHTGLTDIQRALMRDFYSGAPDKELAKEKGLSASTIRYQRYSLKEKARQARVFLALAELLEERTALDNGTLPKLHETATMIDERYMTTDEEQRRIISGCFSSLDPPVLKIFSPKEKKKLVILAVIAGQFTTGRTYSEKEVNAILCPIYEDFATIRRYLVEYGFMGRTSDCREYWVKEDTKV